MPSRLDDGSAVQKPISSSILSSGYKEHQDDSRSSFLSNKLRKTCENVGKYYELLFKMIGAVPGRNMDELELILGKMFMRYASGSSVTLKDTNREDQQRLIKMQ